MDEPALQRAAAVMDALVASEPVLDSHCRRAIQHGAITESDLRIVMSTS